MKTGTLRCALWLMSFVLPACAAFGYVTDTASHTPSAYDTFTPPAATQTFTDSVFGTQIQRVSSALTTPNAADGGMLTYAMDEYSTMSPFNADGSLFLLQHDSYFAVYDGDGGYLGDLPFAAHAGSEPRWSRTDPHVLYFINDNRLRSFDVLAGTMTTVHTFSEYGSISGNGESDIAMDGDHFVLAGDGRYVFVYDMSTDTKGKVLDTGGRGFDSLYLTADGQVTITWFQSGTSRYNGIELFSGDMDFQRQLTHAGGHMDMTRDTNGDAVLVWANSADPAPVCDNGVVKVRVSDGQQTCLATFDWSLALNISCPDDAGACIVDSYAPADPSPSASWPAYTNEVLEVMLDGSEVRRFAHHRSRPYNSYNYTPRATVSRDGAKVLYSSNFGLQKIAGAPTEYADTYLFTVPATSGSGGGTTGGDGGSGGGGGGSTPPSGTTTRYEETAAEVTFTGTWFDNTLSGHSGGSAKLAVDPGSRVTFSFTGTGASWIGYRDEWSGIAKVSVDGTVAKTVDTYASPAQSQATLYSVTGLTDGAHTLTVEATGNIGPSSAGGWVWVDAFEATAGSGSGGGGGGGTTTPTRIEENAAAVDLSGRWYPNGLRVHSGHSAILANDKNASARVSFDGTGIRWIGYRDEWAGIAQVYLDGALQKAVDTYATPAEAQAILYSIEGLPQGPHTLEVRVTGSHSQQSADSWVWVDAFEVLSSSPSGAQTATCGHCVSISSAQ